MSCAWGRSRMLSVLALTRRFGVELRHLSRDDVLPGSYWGDSEAGLRGNVLYVRADTPLHSLLHELSHFVCMSRRAPRRPRSRCGW